MNVFKLVILFILLFKASERGHDKVVSLLINHPQCDLNEKDEDGRTALHFGEYSNIFKLIILFILLFKASGNGHDKVVSILINHPTFNSINERDQHVTTALHCGEYLNIFI